MADLLEALFALAQRLFGLPAVGDVLQRDQHLQALGLQGSNRLPQGMNHPLLMGRSSPELEVHTSLNRIHLAGRKDGDQVGPVIAVNVAKDDRELAGGFRGREVQHRARVLSHPPQRGSKNVLDAAQLRDAMRLGQPLLDDLDLAGGLGDLRKVPDPLLEVTDISAGDQETEQEDYPCIRRRRQIAEAGSRRRYQKPGSSPDFKFLFGMQSPGHPLCRCFRRAGMQLLAGFRRGRIENMDDHQR